MGERQHHAQYFIFNSFQTLQGKDVKMKTLLNFFRPIWFVVKWVSIYSFFTLAIFITILILNAHFDYRINEFWDWHRRNVPYFLFFVYGVFFSPVPSLIRAFIMYSEWRKTIAKILGFMIFFGVVFAFRWQILYGIGYAIGATVAGVAYPYVFVRGLLAPQNKVS